MSRAPTEGGTELASLADYLNKPEYAFRPTQILRRLGGMARSPGSASEIRLPWGPVLHYSPRDEMGRAIWSTGVYDLAVSEVLWRLVEPGEVAVDAGANIGYMTSLLVMRVGAAGRVSAFEPHPDVFAELAANAARWRALAGAGPVELRRAALSDSAGASTLVEGPEFAHNRGTAHLAGPDIAEGHSVRLTTLDDEIPARSRIGVLKIDVEGHEAAVLGGAVRLVGAHAVRDVVYEEHGAEPGAATALLRSHGYAVYRILKSFWGPALASADARRGGHAWMPPNYLATCDPARAEGRLAPRGWRCLRGVSP